MVWLGARVLRQAEQLMKQQFTELLVSKLRDTDQAIAGLLAARARQMERLLDLPAHETEALRELARTNPLISQIFVLTPDGKLIHPPPTGALNPGERAFLERARHFLVDTRVLDKPGEVIVAQASSSPKPQIAAQASSLPASSAPATSGGGWYSWQWEDGVNLVYWQRTAQGRIVGAELERARLLADVIARLPGNEPDAPAPPEGRIALLGPNGGVLYQWGPFEPAASEKARAELSLSAPLQTWRLAYYASPSFGASSRGSALLGFAVGLLALGLALAGLSVYFYREYSRDVREAAQRVNFVNQVSHELKTPLTNIRMYAELLDEQLPPAEEENRGRQYLGVIVTESQRLSRLITNVLTFARKQRQTLTLHPAPHCVDTVIDATLEQFRPALAAKGVEVRVRKSAPATVLLDSDAVGQILGNLFSNVEKYGASGKLLEVASSQADGVTTITVADRGPGIPASQREKIFQPFYRISDKLSDGVTGAGIGLTIARDLARLHGGDVTLERAEAGARFNVTLVTREARRE